MSTETAMTQPATQAPLSLQVHAEGEVRDEQGNLVETVSTTQTVEVSLDDLRSVVQEKALTDTQLRDLGLDEDTIAQIRSTP